MAAGSFLAGGLSGYTSQASKMKKAGQRGKLRRKPSPPSFRSTEPGSMINSRTFQLGVPTFKHGGKIKKTGLIKAHRGERVLTKKQAKRMKKR